MPAGSITDLQQKLFKRIGVDLHTQKQSGGAAIHRHYGSPHSLTRKENRRLQRTQRKSQRHSNHPSRPMMKRKEGNSASCHRKTLSPVPRILASQFSDVDQVDDMLSDAGKGSDLEYSTEEVENWEDSSGEISADTTPNTTKRRGLSKIHLEKLAQDDAEIEDFERKLGIKKGRRSLPQAFKEDGLEELIGEPGEDIASSEDDMKKRKSVYDDWLSSKRRKTVSRPVSQPLSDSLSRVRSAPTRDMTESVSPGSSVIDEDDTTGGHDSDQRAFENYKQPQRENPYIAPTGGSVTAKYVPLSRRYESTESEKLAQPRLQRQVRGLINRLTDTNLISIVQSVEELYQSNARAEVTDILTDAILAQLRKQESLSDQFFVLIGGFSAAVYKITGSSFGSHLVRNIVKEFGEYYGQAADHDSSQQALKKEPSNFLTFLTQLYVFEVVSCKIVFDYMEKLLDNLSELNVELLLRVCRMAGKLLRRDDPQALKHVSNVLSSSVNSVGYTNISVRTKFMIETIQGLKNNKPSAKGTDSTIVSEHVLRMKKRLGELKSQSRRLDGLAPMGIGLKDTESVDKHGKWWLVGASVPTYRDAEERARMISKTVSRDLEDAADDEDMDFVLPDYPSKAKAQGLHTGTQIAIFTAIMSGLNYEHGHRQFVGLKLKKDDQLEITRVLVQCVGSEPDYNEYYALVGGQACLNSRIRFAFQDRLWKIFRSLGESLFGEGSEEAEETTEGERLKNERRLGNIAQFYASLVANGALSISILKPIDLPELNVWASLFVELFLLSLLRQCRGKETNEDLKVKRIFGPASELPALAANLHWFLRKKVRKSKHIENKQTKAMQRVRQKAQAAIQGSDGDRQ
ncbi:MIF4G domain containing protein [Metarhizium acridum CQMa 102]|uniref:MIF4G domain containing protein n=1 Tax=Metarhizium acridum (strain CQMa 102) TaxID=655827 RepID=E9DS37_METAQ|nr:MIF4G domain containing protein [Metarhizium acridum CQMa 102]EFY93619.1 MIF4G domain containing protein [Metarhizium acridum CQMa 102]